jgi:hypothetical protein
MIDLIDRKYSDDDKVRELLEELDSAFTALYEYVEELEADPEDEEEEEEDEEDFEEEDQGELSLGERITDALAPQISVAKAAKEDRKSPPKERM